MVVDNIDGPGIAALLRIPILIGRGCIYLDSDLLRVNSLKTSIMVRMHSELHTIKTIYSMTPPIKDACCLSRR